MRKLDPGESCSKELASPLGGCRVLLARVPVASNCRSSLMRQSVKEGPARLPVSPPPQALRERATEG
eukprot:11798754-Alexandrium_andersonii.AAC.1